MKLFKISSFVALLLCGLCACQKTSTFSLQSPNCQQELYLDFSSEAELGTLSIKSDATPICEVNLGLAFQDQPDFSGPVNVVSHKLNSVNQSWERVWGKRKKVTDQYTELKVKLQESKAPNRLFDLEFRVYNEGVAFRYIVPMQEGMDTIRVLEDLTSFHFAEDLDTWSTKYAGSYSPQENEFEKGKLSDLNTAHLPYTIKVTDSTWVMLTEANLTNWAGMHLVGDSTKPNTVGLSLERQHENDQVSVVSAAPLRSSWRTLLIGNHEASFLESDLIHNLNEPLALEDVSWIKPGKSAWDWWWSMKYAPDQDFELGPNSETMKLYIDLAAEMAWEYQLVDWYWYGKPFNPLTDYKDNPNQEADITTCNPDINIEELVAYGKERNVKILVWLEWHHANWQMEEAFPLYEKWGVAGVKIDFMSREDQEMVDFYHRTVKLAAKHHLLVDFHGAYKPTGISRTYPNLITREGVLGNEFNKWTKRITPEHTVTLAFTRNALGEMDFTPGAFVNTTKAKHKTQWQTDAPMAIGTRANQLAMMVVFESALQVLCDAPYNYKNSPIGVDFLKQVPTTWDDTKVLNGKMGDYITVARRSGDTWYVGGMTDDTSRSISLNFDFLDVANYQATIWQDGKKANEEPTDAEVKKFNVTKNDSFEILLANGGGFVMILAPERKK